VLYGQEIEVPHFMRISIITVRRTRGAITEEGRREDLSAEAARATLQLYCDPHRRAMEAPVHRPRKETDRPGGVPSAGRWGRHAPHCTETGAAISDIDVERANPTVGHSRAGFNGQQLRACHDHIVPSGYRGAGGVFQPRVIGRGCGPVEPAAAADGLRGGVGRIAGPV